VRQAVKALFDDLLKLVGRSALGYGLDPVCELGGFGVI
jgi:hypothetical protein